MGVEEQQARTPRQLFERDPARRLSCVGSLVGAMPAYPKGDRWEGAAISLVHALTLESVDDEHIADAWQRLVGHGAPGSYLDQVATGMEEA